MKALVVEKDKLRKNIDIVKKRADQAMIFGVLKGNGSGLGLIELARILRDDGISRFAVTEPSDALRLRGAGFCDEEILIIRSAADEEDIKTIIEACATATVGSSEAAAALNGVAERDGIVMDGHIVIDTGMGRYGFLPGEMDKVLSVYKYMKNLNVTGIYTHFHSAFSNRAATKAQQEARFSRWSRRSARQGLNRGSCMRPIPPRCSVPNLLRSTRCASVRLSPGAFRAKGTPVCSAWAI